MFTHSRMIIHKKIEMKIGKNFRYSFWAQWHEMLTSEKWWHHQMETFSTLLALCAGNSPVTGGFPSQRPVTRSFDIFFHLCLNKRLSKQSWGWWFEPPSCSLWRHCNEDVFLITNSTCIHFLHTCDASIPRWYLSQPSKLYLPSSLPTFTCPPYQWLGDTWLRARWLLFEGFIVPDTSH